MNRQAVAQELTAVAKLLTAAKTFSLDRDIKTKGGEQFYAGQAFRVESWGESPRWLMKLVAELDGRKLTVSIESGHRIFRHFPKPPSTGVMEFWSEQGRAKAVDGEYTEPDGTSSSGAPSWMLVTGMI